MAEPSVTMTPDAFERRLMKFWTWNGDDPAPEFSHWTNQGRFTIRACTPGRPAITEVLFNDRRLGFGHHPLVTADNLKRGSYDKELGVAAETFDIPRDLLDWNNL